MRCCCARATRPPSKLPDWKKFQPQSCSSVPRSIPTAPRFKSGIKTPQEAQIVSGLKAGEQVVTQGAYGLPDGIKVTIEKPSSAGEEGKNKEAAGKDKEDR